MARTKKERVRAARGLGAHPADAGTRIKATPRGRMTEAPGGSFEERGRRASAATGPRGAPRKARAAQARRRTRRDNRGL